jgi:type IV pilus assembly protein PilW
MGIAMNQPTQHQRFQRQQGMTLIEIMISLAIGLIILLAISATYVTSGQSIRQRQNHATIDDPARVFTRLLRNQIANAGYVDMLDQDAAGTNANGASIFQLSDESANTFRRENAFRSANPNEPNPAWIPTTPFSVVYKNLPGVFGCNGDMMRTPTPLGLAANPVGALVCNGGNATQQTLQIAYQGVARTGSVRNSRSTQAVANATTGEGLDCLSQAPDASNPNGLIINRFFVNNNTISCLGSGNNIPQPMIDGVQELMFRYQTSPPVIGQAAGGTQGAYLTATEVAASPQQWAGVTAIEVCMVLGSDIAQTDGAMTGLAQTQTTRPTCTRQADGQFIADVNLAIADRSRLWKRYVNVVSIRNAVFASSITP